MKISAHLAELSKRQWQAPKIRFPIGRSWHHPKSVSSPCQHRNRRREKLQESKAVGWQNKKKKRETTGFKTAAPPPPPPSSLPLRRRRPLFVRFSSLIAFLPNKIFKLLITHSHSQSVPPAPAALMLLLPLLVLVRHTFRATD